MSIYHGAKNALGVVHKYYKLLDDSEVYWVAMSDFGLSPPQAPCSQLFTVFHLRYKITYFHAKEWPKHWIENAITFT